MVTNNSGGFTLHLLLFIHNSFLLPSSFLHSSFLRYDYEHGVGGGKAVRSGECFDFRLLNVLGVFIGFPNSRFECRALPDLPDDCIANDGTDDIKLFPKENDTDDTGQGTTGTTDTGQDTGGG